MVRFLILWLQLWQLAFLGEAATNFRWTNVKCEAFDKSFAEFAVCRLVVPSRNRVVFNLHVTLHKTPVTNSTINLSLMKKASGFRPFMYNYTVDFCQFMVNKRRYPFIKVFFDFILRDSNINHTCPYYDDLVIRDMVITNEHFRMFPLPLGEYMFKLMVAAYNDWKANVQIYFKIYEGL